MRWLILSAALAAPGAAPGPGEVAPELRPPVKLQAGGRPIDVGRSGHAAPFVGDLDGDGRPDLLVGQFHEGRLRVYRDLNKKGAPRLAEFTYFRAGADLGRVPTG